MKLMKKALCLLFCVVLLVGSAVNASADKNTVIRPVVTIDTVTAAAGDTVYVKVRITETTYLQAMAFAITYDNTALSFVEYLRGDLTDYMTADHKTHVNFVDCEGKNFKIDVTVGTFVFKVKEEANGGFYDIRLANRQPNRYGEDLTGAFANGRGDTIIPTVVNGGVNIPITQGNCRHNFGEWKAVFDATCDKEGIAVRNCSRCGKNEDKIVDALPHDFEENWTVDREATADKFGVMSRHCKNCDEKTDIKTFELDVIEEEDFENEVGASVDKETVNKNEDVIEDSDIVIEQKPNEEEINKEELTPDELIELKKEDKKYGLFARIYVYFFGDENYDGIFSIIFKALKDYCKKLF